MLNLADYTIRMFHALDKALDCQWIVKKERLDKRNNRPLLDCLVKLAMGILKAFPVVAQQKQTRGFCYV